MADDPLQSFNLTLDSIRSLICCADVFGLHALAAFRGEGPDLALIKGIITEGRVSLQAHSWQWMMNESEYEKLDKDGHLRKVCEHIVFASYVAVEAYLKAKFKQYFEHMYKAPDKEKLNLLVKRVSLRSLEELNDGYKKYLGIKLDEFRHPQIGVHAEAKWFHPNSCWGGLKHLERCRNQLAHDGRMNDARVVALVDAVSVFEFCRDYVMFLNNTHDSYVYKGRALRY